MDSWRLWTNWGRFFNGEAVGNKAEIVTQITLLSFSVFRVKLKANSRRFLLVDTFQCYLFAFLTRFSPKISTRRIRVAICPSPFSNLSLFRKDVQRNERNVKENRDRDAFNSLRSSLIPNPFTLSSPPSPLFNCFHSFSFPSLFSSAEGVHYSCTDCSKWRRGGECYCSAIVTKTSDCRRHWFWTFWTTHLAIIHSTAVSFSAGDSLCENPLYSCSHLTLCCHRNRMIGRSTQKTPFFMWFHESTLAQNVLVASSASGSQPIECFWNYH